ncbi:MAG: TRAP transporter fused permease subunit [Pseudomonadota bacterium]
MRSEAMTQNENPDTPEEEQKSVLYWVTVVLAISISLGHILVNTFSQYIPLFNISDTIRNGFHYGGFVLLCALVIPFSQKAFAQKGIVRILDIGFGLLVAMSAIYLVYGESAIYDRGVRLTALDVTAGCIAIIGAIEFTRRTTGLIIPSLIIIALTYAALWGQFVPGVFRFPGLSFETLMFRSIYGDDALFGNIANISSTFVFLFIIFGAFLLKSGAGEFIIDLARAIAGRFIGGPGFVAVLASGLTGTISGSAVANTASTGVITIPLMKRAGFPPHFAGGVEAASSTGGQLMPPIMGAGAFVMAATTQIPYTTIITVSFLPAILYFLTVGFFVRIEAKRSGATGLMHEENPPLLKVLREGGPQFILPVALLIYLLVNGFSPTYAAGWAILTCIVASWVTPRRMGIKDILGALELGARNMILTGVLLCAVGLIVNIIATAGVGNTFSLMISDWSNGSLFIAIILVALASLILGMGLPVTAAYIVLGTLSAPAIYQLILQGEIIEQMVAGTLPEAAKAIFLIAAPDQIAALGAPMSSADAGALLARVPLESMNLIIENAFEPALLTTALLSAHMVIFWLSQDSNVTPPVCLAAFTGAAIAKAPPMKTGFFAWKIAKGLYFVPLLIAYTPLLSGDWFVMLEIFVFAVFGLWALSAAIEGYWENKLPFILRVLVLVIALALLWPSDRWIHLIALAAFSAMFFWNIRMGRSAKPGSATGVAG